MTIIEALEEKSSLLFGGGVSEVLINNAEEFLKLEFADDYKEYLLEYGIVAYDGHELTGINMTGHLDVCDVTISQRSNNHTVPNTMYVIEVANIDGIIIWQSTDGIIYQTVFNSEPVKLCESLTEYVSL